VKTLVIGIDALDPVLLSRYLPKLPNMRRIAKCGTMQKLASVYPPDSIPAWATIYTGLDPCEHGIHHTVDYLSKNFKSASIDTTLLQGNTFWDVAGKAGRKVCIINPFLAYPPWPVNGIMVSGPVFEDGTVKSYPPSLVEEYDLPQMGGITDFPTKKDLDQIIEDVRVMTFNEASFGQRLIEEKEWDLFFICFLTLDRIQHFFWRFCDEDDPIYPGENPYKDVIVNFYKLFDEIIGEFVDCVDSDTAIIVLSDHGHGMRGTKFLNINEILRQRKYLAPKDRRVLNKGFLIEKIKANVIRWSCRFGVEELIYRLGKYVPKNKELQKSTFAIDFNESLAYACDFAGMTSFGGIEINEDRLNRDGIDYENFREKLIKEILELTDPDDNEKLVKWCYKKEKLYKGKFAYRYPDIIFELEQEFSVNWSIYDSIISPSYVHRFVSGGHRWEGVLLVSNLEKTAFNVRNLEDIAPTILDVLNKEV